MKRWKEFRFEYLRTAAVFLLLCAMACTLIWALPAQVHADYTEPYMKRMEELGLLQGDADGDLRPGDPITRAEFVTIINRAFGYRSAGGHPFRDVPGTAWYAEDVDIGYTEGYITGTSPTAFSPNLSITREEAAFILAKNLMMEPAVGENTSFADGRSISTWSRGMVSAAAENNLISGYPDGTFRPQKSITRGEAAVILLNAVGTPVSRPGTTTLGDVWGNVTITSSGVTLKDTVVAGNLYVTAGVELGDVVLENVKVLGEIVVSGGGVSEAGEDSVILRNVDAPKLVVDNIKNQQVSLRVEGDGLIQQASVRTDAFFADNTPAGHGIGEIELNGENGLELKLAGNIKNVVNRTPESALSISSGRVDTITVDEKAVDSTLEISSGAEVDHVNLDVGTTVTGDGDIGDLVVNAPGSNVSMLPDQIVIRPGDTANIDGENMDSEAAAESSADPRLLSGYPKITDLAPTSATAQFSGNKRGTVYWAVTSVTDGSVGTDELIDPPSYTTKIVANGSAALSGAGERSTAKISKLVSDGSYYLSAVLVDARGDQSPLKVLSFTTPDNTVPGFADGYPYMSKVTNVSAQVTVMATKSCRLYWALLPKGAQAPTAQDFKANAVTGNLGYGSRDVTKNTAYSFDVNNVALEELESYDLYLWLTDVEGGQSSRVEKLSFTTVDRTPPKFNTNATVNKVERTSVGLYANLNEAGTLYWVVVEQGTEYPKPLAGQSGPVDLSSDTAKMQVSAGMNALKSGKVNMSQDKDVSFNVSGLDPEKAYDLYYVAQDKAGNYSARVQVITIHTLDPSAPTVVQEFTRYNGDESGTPYPDTDIRLVFSEEVQDAAANVTLKEYYDRVTAAKGETEKEQARTALGNVLRNSIKLYVDTGSGRPELVADGVDAADKTQGGWVIDYRYAEVTMEEGKTVVIFRTADSEKESALNLQSGAEYHFEIEANTISDTSDAKNIMGKTKLDTFKTIFAVVNLSNPNESTLEGTITDYHDPGQEIQLTGDDKLVDISWLLAPATTESVPDNVDWDMIIWSDTSIAFDLYRRTNLAETPGKWERIGEEIELTVPDGDDRRGVSLTRILQKGNNPQFQQLNQLLEENQYEYAVHFTRVGTLGDRDTWSQRVTMGVTVVAGSTSDLGSLANGRLDSSALEEALAEGVTNIGQPDDFTLRKQFSDQTPPIFVDNRPNFETGDSSVKMYLMLDRPGTIYYMVAPYGTVTTEGEKRDGSKKYHFSTDKTDYEALPKNGENDPGSGGMEYPFNITAPTPLSIINAGNQANARIKHGSIQGGATEVEKIVQDLEVKTDYIAYFVIQGSSSQVYSEVYAYRFSTDDVTPAYITMRAVNPEVEFTTSQDATLYYSLFASNKLPPLFGQNLARNHLDPEYRDEVGTEITDLTLLEAIQKTINGVTGESYFDRYASEETKEQVRQAITSQTSSEALDKGSIPNMAQKEPQAHDFTNAMDPESATAYVCLATAQNALGGKWTFKAVDGVRIPDEDAPVLLKVTTTVTKVNDAADPVRVSGTVTLQFSETIYHINDSGNPDTLRAIIQRDVDKQKEVGFLNLVNQSQSNLKYSKESGNTTNTITLDFWDAPVGATFSFCNTGHLADASANSRQNDSYTLELQPTEGIGLITGGTTYHFVVTQGNYPGN
ncbi:S-layer homology domain-containing protein [Clostridium sp. DFI.5.61]|uniref:S-layer homology domain-containing protein n=1 Tax=Clostridium sp. DFI.5.61 TaxID=2965279 RepID=UPI00210D7578|nr:S-layer homology domain-containing protein [Clostridium sp. DFI.5.61]MCB5925266.1 S-layer homology domain-containing protein [bacterium 210820-DFI.5.26]MCQ5158990.1 S-layer homology domain-containing protein [Clostridium sp. DFI.5.61]